MDLRNDPADLTPKDKMYQDEVFPNPSPMHSEDMQHKIALIMKEREQNKHESNLRIPTEEDQPQEDVRIGFENVPKKRLKKKKILRVDRNKVGLDQSKEAPITETQVKVPEEV